MPSSSTRSRIIESGLAILGNPNGPTMTLESAARVAGISKPGLMYHFPTKDALVRGVVDHVVDSWESRLRDRVGGDPAVAGPEDRIGAYVEVALEARRDLGEFAVFSDAHYRDELCRLWTDRIGPWVEVPAELSPEAQGRLHAARLAADGLWLAAVTGVLDPTPSARDAIAATVRGLVEQLR